MSGFETLILLMAFAVLLVGLAQKLRIPYPIALVVGGAFIGFIPEIRPVSFQPNIILIVVLPPILYYAAFSISFQEFKKNIREIFSLALGLVVATTLVVGVGFKFLFPEHPWALAFAFGAIVSPPDAVAATTILKRFSINARLLAILEGESLVNDASALVLYKIAVVAILSGAFSFMEASASFVEVVSGGVLIGVISGFLLQGFSTRFLEPIVGVVFSFTIPYITYIVSDLLEVSGVLAVVVNGLIGSRFLITHRSSLRRVIGFAVWDIYVILLNCFVFILIGLQLKTIAQEMTTGEIAIYTGYGALITLLMIVVRMLWVYLKKGFSYLKAYQDPLRSSHCPQILNEAAILGWAGMRGIVSLAAALALPFTLPDGTPIAGREQVIFIVFIVILLTLLIPGLTLPKLISCLKIHHKPEVRAAVQLRKSLEKVAHEEIQHLHSTGQLSNEEREFLTTYFHSRHQMLELSSITEAEIPTLELARRKVVQAERQYLLQLWKQREIDDHLLRFLEQELDSEEAQSKRAAL